MVGYPKEAVASLFSGILSFIFGGIPFFGWILVASAIGLGILALKKKKGRSLALAGIFLGTLVLLGLLAGTAYNIIVQPPV